MKEMKGHLILLMGPMGSGKGTLVKHVQEKFPELQFAVSGTTRNMRPGETDGVEYYFLTTDEFDEKVKNNDFLEWAEFSGNKYGTLKSEILEQLDKGKVVLNEIELQGVQQLLPIVPEANRTLVYVESGQWESLRDRALARAPISEEHLVLRHERYLEEIQMKPYADVIIQNENNKQEDAKQQMANVVQDVFSKVNK